MRFLILMAALGTATAAEAQIRLPAPLASLPVPTLQQNLGAPDPWNAGTVRRQAAARLIRNNRRLIEADPDGDPIVRGEVLAVGIDEQTLLGLRARGFGVQRTESISAVDLEVVVLRVPEGRSTRAALEELRAADARGIYDYDHLYLGSGPSRPDAKPPSPRAPADPPARIRVGLLDSGVDETHPAFKGSDIHPWGCGGRKEPSAHGTAVASLLVARGEAELFAADVYCGDPTGGSAEIIAAALGWMAEERVSVINISLVGPRNLLLERIVGALIARGHIIVAAVGNDGPAAPPLYPAAYPEVVGVTGVDARRHVLIEAERGPQVMFAALGADIKAAGPGHGYAAVRGTSFAAPAVAALLAAMAPRPDRKSSLDAIDALAKIAIDLGPAGRDLTYGFGLVGADAL